MATTAPQLMDDISVVAQCAICWCCITLSGVTSCQHHFCYECLRTWCTMTQHPVCPKCCDAIVEIRLDPEFDQICRLVQQNQKQSVGGSTAQRP